VSSATKSLFPSADTLAVFDPADIPAEPEQDEYYRHSVAVMLALRNLWKRRDMVVALAERDIRASYKQAVLGIGWALISPVIQVVIFTVIFTKVKLFHVAHIPYALYSYVGILCWSSFSGSLSSGGGSLISNMSLLQKTHFPRECFPLSQILEQTVYTTIALLPLGILFVYYGYTPRVETVYVPIFIVIEVVFTAGVVLAMAAMIVYLRDLIQVMGLIITVGLYASPVVWPFSEIPHALQPVYAFINPLGPVIDNFRRTMLLGQQPHWSLLGIAAVSAVIYFFVGYRIFKRLEVSFADIS
jgi:lipopolysaccharide transport system permease protein